MMWGATLVTLGVTMRPLVTALALKVLLRSRPGASLEDAANTLATATSHTSLEDAGKAIAIARSLKSMS